MVADVEELENVDASEKQARRLNAKEIIKAENGESFIFSIADGTVKLCGRDDGLRKSTSMRDQPVRSEELGRELQGGSDTSQPIHEMSDDREARDDFLVDRRELHVSSSRETKS